MVLIWTWGQNPYALIVSHWTSLYLELGFYIWILRLTHIQTIATSNITIRRNKTTGLGIFPFLPGKKNPYISNDFWKHKIKQVENRLRCDQKPTREGSNSFSVLPQCCFSVNSHVNGSSTHLFPSYTWPLWVSFFLLVSHQALSSSLGYSREQGMTVKALHHDALRVSGKGHAHVWFMD